MAQPQEWTPVAASERIEALDVLRGFALLGILLMNIEAFVGPLGIAMTGLDPALQGADRWADALVYLLVQGKFWTLFSLLFGMGFAVMMARAQAAGRPFAAVYLRRTLALLAIGLVHALLIWPGDILVTYALTALVLLLCFRNTPAERLPVWGVLLYLAPLLLLFLLALLGELVKLDPAGAAEMHRSMAEQGRLADEMVAAQRAAYGSGDYAAANAQRLADFGVMMGYLFLMLPMALGVFLVGAWFVRSGAIAAPQSRPGLFSKLRLVALPVGLALVLVSFALAPTMNPAAFGGREGAAMLLGAAGSLLVCLGYLGWVVRGLQSPAWLPRLAWLAPAGRMALTNYLLQSLVCTGVFYGYGLGYFEQLPRAGQVPFVLVLFAAQVAFSHWWLARYRFGPMEWLWRAATYLRLPAMRLAAAPAAG